MNDDDHHALRDVIYVLFKRRFRIMFITAIAVAAGFAAVRLGGTTYTASARILAAAPAIAGGAPPLPDTGQTARTQAELLRAPGALEKILPALRARLPAPQDRADRILAWWRGPDDGAALAARLSRAMRSAAVRGTDVVAVSVTWPDPRFAADALNLILAETQRSGSQTADGRQAIETAAAALAESETQVRTLDAQIAGLPVGADAGSLEREKDRVRSRLAASRGTGDALRLERELARRKLDTVDQAYKGGGWVDAPDAQDAPSGAPALQQTFVTLLDKHQTMLTRLPPDAPGVKAVDQQISHVREQNYLAVKQVYTGRLSGLDDRLTQLNADIAGDEARVRDLDDRLVKLDALNQTRAVAVAHEAGARSRLVEARARADAGGRDTASIRVLSGASLPGAPDWPGPPLVVAAAGAAGLALGLASAAFAEMTRRTLDRPRDVARLLGIDVLARVPDLARISRLG